MGEWHKFPLQYHPVNNGTGTIGYGKRYLPPLREKAKLISHEDNTFLF
jgi:hypothetical protein